MSVAVILPDSSPWLTPVGRPEKWKRRSSFPLSFATLFRSQTSMPRSRLGPLAIESRLGDHPSQSCVWRAVHVQLQRTLAVKIFPIPFGATPGARASLAREWEMLKKLDHPAIAKCYGGGFEDNDAYLAHELVEGDTLAAQLERLGRLPWETVLDLAEPIMAAIEYLHARDLVHGRLQPENIIIAGLSPVLVDVRIHRFDTPFRTGRPPAVHEIAVQPPELIAEPTAICPSTDLYTFGAILYLAITGRHPVGGDTAEEVSENVVTQPPFSVASIVMDCPVWFDRLILQLLSKDPSDRPYSASAARLALAEVRRRAMSRSGVAEHASAGFSPLNVTDQKDRDEARLLLGHATLADDESPSDVSSWHDKPWFLIGSLFLIIGIVTYTVWPLNEDQMRERAEALLAHQTRSSLNQAKTGYLQPMLAKFPHGEHHQWARQQIDQVEMVQAEHVLSVKLKRNELLTNEGERLYAEANEFEKFGDTVEALDRYRSIETLLAGDPQYRAYVNLARRQIASIERSEKDHSEAAIIIQAKLDEADQLMKEGKVVSARKIWYSMIELYENNGNVAPLVARAQDRLAGIKMANDGKQERP